MNKVIIGIVLIVLSMGILSIGYLQFMEKGFLLHKVYIWASPEERKRMDENNEGKRPYYRQSGFELIFIGFAFLMFAGYLITDWMWAYTLSRLFVIVFLVYSVVSSIQKRTI